MTTVVQALKELGITEWTLKGKTTNEEEFNANFKKVTGADSNGTAIKSDDPSKFGVTWSQVAAKKKELEDAAPMKELRRQRDLKLVETDYVGAMNICSGQKTTIRDVISSLEVVTGTTPKLEFDESKPSMIPYRTMDGSKMLKLTGWSPSVSLIEGLRRTLNWYEENAKNGH